MTGRKRSRASAVEEEAHTLIVDAWVDRATARAELDGRRLVMVPRSLLPRDAAPDLVLRVERAARSVTIVVDESATEAARLDAARAVRRLRARDPGGDVVL